MAGDILASLKQRISEREANTDDFSVGIEKKSCFLEITGVLTKKIVTDRIPDAMRKSNVYNAKSFLGKVIIEGDLGQVLFIIQYAIEDEADAIENGNALIEYMFDQMEVLSQWASEVNANGCIVGEVKTVERRRQFNYDKFSKAFEVYEQLIQTLKIYKIRYENIPNYMEVCCKMDGINLEYTYYIEVKPDLGELQFLAVLSEAVPETDVRKFIEWCMDLNRKVWGCFYIDSKSGEVIYDLTTAYSSCMVSSDWIAAQIAMAEKAISVWNRKIVELN